MTMEKVAVEICVPQLPTGDIEKTASFFSDCLGFEIVAKYEAYNYLIVKRANAEIHFWQTSENNAKELGSQSGCYIRVKGIESLFEEFKNRGTQFRYELTEQPWGMKEMQVDDPYLNAIRFGEPVS